MKKTITSTQAPAAIGPYSQAVQAGPFLFVSGQIPLDPATGQLIAGGVQDATRQVMTNLQRILEAAGANFSNVVKTTIYLVDMNDFAAVNEVYAGYFAAEPPARATVAVARLPKDARVEVDAVAYLGP